MMRCNAKQRHGPRRGAQQLAYHGQHDDQDDGEEALLTVLGIDADEPHAEEFECVIRLDETNELSNCHAECLARRILARCGPTKNSRLS
jgi:hypothetical protein